MNVTRIFTNAAHLELACRVHRILVAVGKGELAIPRSDREAVHRFVDEAFFVTQFLGDDLHSEAKARASRPNAAPGRPATGGPGVSETMDNGNDACRRNSGAGGAEMPNGECDKDAEARSIAAELVRLHKAGAIKNEPDASFYAKLVKRFGASFGNETSKQGGNRSKRET